MYLNNDTICAVSTPFGRSATGMVRVSGDSALDIVNRIFDGDVFSIKTSSVCHGYIFDGPSCVDDVVVTVFRAPKSYTGEDVVEISCHGSVFILKRLIALLIKNGARQATNGEFTKRAFINGKLDLTQAEAVIDLIDADSKAGTDAAINRIRGGVSKKINSVYDSLLNITSQLFAVVDYPDEEIDDVTSDQLYSAMELAYNEIKKLTDTYFDGCIIRDGIKTSIAGKPNAGKSTLMNLLVGYDRSIVDDTAGTTRDYIEENAYAGSLKLVLWDTAGLRETDDKVEHIGVERTREKISESDLIIAVFDSSTGITDDDRFLLNELSLYDVPKIAVWNKTDLGDPPSEISDIFTSSVHLCGKTGEGIDDLKNKISEVFAEAENPGDVICDLRQYECLMRAQDSLSCALNNKGAAADMLLADAENAIEALGEMTGKTVSEQIVNNIFSRFCVGK